MTQPYDIQRPYLQHPNKVLQFSEMEHWPTGQAQNRKKKEYKEKKRDVSKLAPGYRDRAAERREGIVDMATTDFDLSTPDSK